MIDNAPGLHISTFDNIAGRPDDVSLLLGTFAAVVTDGIDEHGAILLRQMPDDATITPATADIAIWDRIASVLTGIGIPGIGIKDIDECLIDCENAYLGVGFGIGPKRVRNAVYAALEHDVYAYADIESAKNVLVIITFSRNMRPAFGVKEASDIEALIKEFNEEASIKWATSIDDTLNDVLKITLIASDCKIYTNNILADSAK